MFRSNPVNGQKHSYRWTSPLSYYRTIKNHYAYKTSEHSIFQLMYYIYEDVFIHRRPRCYYHGVSQGNAISPTLSNYMISHLLLNRSRGGKYSSGGNPSSQVDVLQYADDGILYSDTPFDPETILSFSHAGIEPN